MKIELNNAQLHAMIELISYTLENNDLGDFPELAENIVEAGDIFKKAYSQSPPDFIIGNSIDKPAENRLKMI